MRTVYKYPLKVEDGKQCILLPEDSKLVTIGSQEDKPVMWFEVDPSTQPLPEIFRVYGTGQPIHINYDYTGSSFCGMYVWHVYRKVRNMRYS